MSRGHGGPVGRIQADPADAPPLARYGGAASSQSAGCPAR